MVEAPATSWPIKSTYAVRRGAFPSRFPSVPRRRKGRFAMLKALVALGAVAAASALLVPTVVFANPMSANDDVEHVSKAVQYGDLNLAQAKGVYRLKRRINY